MFAEESKNKEALEILLGTLEENPDLWETRKKTAKLLYQDKKFLEAADILWGAPEIPATDVDVAFALQVISRVKPNRSIRLIYEVLRRNKGKPMKNMAVARALNDVGLYMEASRFYGAAIADDTKLFNLAFERQILWMDDSKRLIEEWTASDQEAKIPLDVPSQDLSGGMLRPSGIHNEIDSIVDGVTNPEPAQAPAIGAPVPTQPLVAPSGAKPLPSPSGLEVLSSAGPPPPPPVPTNEPPVESPSQNAAPAASASNSLDTPEVPVANRLATPGAGATNALATPGAGVANALATPGAGAANALATPGAGAANALATPGAGAANALATPGAGVANALATPGAGSAKPNSLISDAGTVASQALSMPGVSEGSTNPLAMPETPPSGPPSPRSVPSGGEAPVRSAFNHSGEAVSTQPLAVPNVVANQSDPQPAPEKGPATRPLLVAGVGAPAEPEQNPAPAAASSGGLASRPLLVAGAPQQTDSPPVNKLLTPGSGAPPPSNLLIPGSGAGGDPANPQKAVSGQGAPLAAENTNASGAQMAMPPSQGSDPLATTPMLRRPAGAMPAQAVQAGMPGQQPAMAYPGAPGMPMPTQPMVPVYAVPGMPMPGMPMPGMPMPGMPVHGMPMHGMPVHGMPVPTQPITQPITQPMMPVYPGMMPMATQPLMPGQVMAVPQPTTQQMAVPPSGVPGMPMATQPLVPGQVPVLPGQPHPNRVQYPAQATAPPTKGTAGIDSGPGAGLRFK